MSSEGIVGTCLSMCPESELREREKAGLIHYFEKSEALSSGGGGGGRGGTRNRLRVAKESFKADINKTVKEYTRPAAGVNKSKPSDLRPPKVLKKTVAYLCTKVLTRTDREFIDVYNFVFDRLRAVRQDIVIQRISDHSAIAVLEATVKFHLYAEHRFRKDAPMSYDPVINQKHLRDCLQSLLELYELNNFKESSRPFFEALYCLSSPESYEVILRAFAIKGEMEAYPVFLISLDICLAIQNRNFYKFFQLLDELPALLAAYLVEKVPFMRKHALKAMAVSYGVKTCKIPLEWITELLCYPNETRAEKEMLKIGCEINRSPDSNEKFVKFEKTSLILNTDRVISIDVDVKFTILNGLNNTEVISSEQICPWGMEFA